MGLIEGFKSFSYARIADILLRYSSEFPDESIIKFLKLARRIPKDPENDIVTGINYIIRVFEQRHPALEVVTKLITETHPNVR